MALEFIEITDADGVARKVSADQFDTDRFVQALKIAFGADGVAPILASSVDPLPTVDAALATALASLLTELGQKLEPGDLAALATAAKQDTAKTVLDAILADSQAKADLAETQPVSAASLPLPSGASSSAKQDTAQTRLDLLATEAKLEAVRALLAATLSVGLDATSLAALESITIGTALPAGSSVIGKVGIDPTATSSGDATQVASSASSVTLKASNSSRKALWIFNDSTQVLHVRLAATAASATAKNLEIPAGGFWEHPTTGPMYTGEVRGIWDSANGNAYVTEL